MKLEKTRTDNNVTEFTLSNCSEQDGLELVEVMEGHGVDVLNYFGYTVFPLGLLSPDGPAPPETIFVVEAGCCI